MEEVEGRASGEPGQLLLLLLRRPRLERGLSSE